MSLQKYSVVSHQAVQSPWIILSIHSLSRPSNEDLIFINDSIFGKFTHLQGCISCYLFFKFDKSSQKQKSKLFLLIPTSPPSPPTSPCWPHKIDGIRRRVNHETIILKMAQRFTFHKYSETILVQAEAIDPSGHVNRTLSDVRMTFCHCYRGLFVTHGQKIVRICPCDVRAIRTFST